LGQSLLQRSFERILADEIGSDADPRTIGLAVVRMCERISHSITPLVGARATEALLARSLRLTYERFPRTIAAARSGVDESLSARVEIAVAQQAPGEARGVALSILVTFSEQLASFVGDTLMTSALRQAWPSFAGDDDFEGPAS